MANHRVFDEHRRVSHIVKILNSTADWRQHLSERVILRLAKLVHAKRAVVHWVFDRRHGTFVFVARTATFSLLIDLTILIPLIFVWYWLTPNPDAIDTIQSSIFGLLVIAPIFENICLLFVIEFLVLFDLRRSTIVLAVASLSGIAHGLAGGWRAFAGATGFAIMTVSYFAWEDRRVLQRYFITVAQHVTMNLLPALVLLLSP